MLNEQRNKYILGFPTSGSSSIRQQSSCNLITSTNQISEPIILFYKPVPFFSAASCCSAFDWSTTTHPHPFRTCWLQMSWPKILLHFTSICIHPWLLMAFTLLRNHHVHSHPHTSSLLLCKLYIKQIQFTSTFLSSYFNLYLLIKMYGCSLVTLLLLCFVSRAADLLRAYSLHWSRCASCIKL